MAHTFKIGESPNIIEITIPHHETDVQDIYDEVESELTIQSGKYCVHQVGIWISLKNVYLLYQELNEVYQELKGKVIFSNVEESFYIEVTLHSLGQLNVEGYIQDLPSVKNKLAFEFQLDQSYLPKTIDELKDIFAKLGQA